tara:strand:- start:546 stop:830 length:285 start_codon:yes stop_codon:yes gene_type:complete
MMLQSVSIKNIKKIKDEWSSIPKMLEYNCIPLKKIFIIICDIEFYLGSLTNFNSENRPESNRNNAPPDVVLKKINGYTSTKAISLKMVRKMGFG